MTVAQTADIRSLPLAALTFSTTPAQRERRAHLDKAKLAELADSIKSHGLVQPILVRPLKGVTAAGLNGTYFPTLGKSVFSPGEVEKLERNHFEIVAGERRAIAAKQAGLQEIQATVRDLTDEQCLELQLIENLQRQDLHELAEAEGYEALQKLGHSVEDMAAQVGKSRGTIYARMKLLALCPEGRKAYYEGKLGASTALYVSRIPPALQKQALVEITKPKRWDEEKSPMSAREAQKHIHDHYMLSLASAGFKTADPDLVPAAGACGACPKRTGNQRELFGDVKNGDVCTDPLCFKQKIAAHAERVIASAAATGQQVLTGAEAKKIARHGTGSHSLEGYVRLDAHDYHGSGKSKTFRQTLGKAYVPTLLQDPDSGKMLEVAPNEDVDKAHGDKHLGGNDAHSKRYQAEQRATERKHRQEIAYRVALFKAIHEAPGTGKALARADLELIAERLFERTDHDAKKRLFAALGWEPQKSRHHNGVSLDLPTPFNKMSEADLARHVRACMLAHELQVWQHSGETRPKALEAAAASLGVDAQQIRKKLADEQKAKDGKKVAPAKSTKRAKKKAGKKAS